MNIRDEFSFREKCMETNANRIKHRIASVMTLILHFYYLAFNVIIFFVHRLGRLDARFILWRSAKSRT